MKNDYESSERMNTLTEDSYEQFESLLGGRIEYLEDRRAAVALGHFLGEDKESDELEKIEGEIFMGEALKGMLEANIGEEINIDNATTMLQGYLQEPQY